MRTVIPLNSMTTMRICARDIVRASRTNMGYLQLSSSQVLFIYLLQGGVEIIPDDPHEMPGGIEVMRGNN